MKCLKVCYFNCLCKENLRIAIVFIYKLSKQNGFFLNLIVIADICYKKSNKVNSSKQGYQVPVVEVNEAILENIANNPTALYSHKAPGSTRKQC